MANAKEVLNGYDQLIGGVGPEFGLFQDFIDMCMKGYKVSTLDYLTCQLILICVVCAINSSETIIFSHVKMYVEGGGKREDLVSALNMCIMACGGPGLAWGAAALKAYDELTADK